MLHPGATTRTEQRSLGILLVTEIPLTLNLFHIRYLISDIYIVIRYAWNQNQYLNKTVKCDSEQITQIGNLGFLRLFPTFIDL